MTLATVALDDKYEQQTGRVYLTGIQALVRLPLMQRSRDRAAGLRTAGFISGYRGSPLGGYDVALWSAKAQLERSEIRFQPGVNEDLAATAIWGTQQVGVHEGATVDGVFALWYGKGPGVDRSMDALKHANSAGTSLHGGVVALVGDDHGCKSSTLAHQSEQVLIAAMIPIVNPATLQEILDFGQIAFAMSRYCGCWIGLKTIAETIETSATVDVDPGRVAIVAPTEFAMPRDGLNLRWPDPPLQQERRLHGPKMQAAMAFARANGLDRVVFDSPGARLGIVTTGKAYLDVRQALEDLDLDDEAIRRLGIRLYKVGLTWPLDPVGARRFSEGLEEILVVEEKRAVIEDQLVRLLYNDRGPRPRIVGKQDDAGRTLLPSEGELSSSLVASAIVGRLEQLGSDVAALAPRLAMLVEAESAATAIATFPNRTPYFCSGCPHNTSTKVPEGSRAMAGIGCHGMHVYYPQRHTSLVSHMGAEGANWIGIAPFTNTKHIFQNLGDGTYFHSGLLAIRAAAAAGVNITYKILFNDAVAMTGGQPVEGPLTVADIVRQVVAEGAKRVVVVADDPAKYANRAAFGDDVPVRHRDELDAVQRELREIPGLTAIVYDQTCAAEKRRRRKRGLYPDPPQRVFINDAVCEGCGDCSEQSNCISILPLATEFGRKRTIDQSSCNKDYSCVKGFCPSFVTVHGGRPRRAAVAFANDARLSAIPSPPAASFADPCNVLISGVGGTGVLTLSALLGMAAHLEGKACSVLDFTGLAQKNGAVMSHVRIASSIEALHAVRIGPGRAQLALACDMVVAVSPVALSRVGRGTSRVVVNSALTPTASFVLDGDVDLQESAMKVALCNAAGPEAAEFLDASGIATALAGDSIASNLFMLGYAAQRGYVPLSHEAIARAIELNGVAVESNLRVFTWGRLAAHDPSAMAEIAAATGRAQPPAEETLADIVERREAFLTQYQDAAWAQRYRSFVAWVERSERERVGGQGELASAVARSLFKLMAYKDEYEVARLYSDEAFRQKLDTQFEGYERLEVSLAPPLFARRNAQGQLEKKAYGAWVFGAFRMLARFKRLRGTPFDIFGYTKERRIERGLIDAYRATIERIVGKLDTSNHALAIEIALLPEGVRGFGHVKQRNLTLVQKRESDLLSAFGAVPAGSTAR